MLIVFQEERFLFPIYPCFILFGAVVVDYAQVRISGLPLFHSLYGYRKILIPKSETRGFVIWLTLRPRTKCRFPLASSDV